MIATRKLSTLLVAVLFSAVGGASLPAAQHPASKPPATQPTAPASATAVVWVNTVSGFYHQPSRRYYGKTKHGKCMSEADAVRAGYRAAQN